MNQNHKELQRFHVQNYEKSFSDVIRLIFTHKRFFDEEPAYKGHLGTS